MSVGDIPARPVAVTVCVHRGVTGVHTTRVCGIFDVPAATVAGRINRARERLRHAVNAVAASGALAEQTLQGLDSYFRGIRAVLLAAK